MARITFLISFVAIIAAAFSTSDLTAVIAPVTRALHNERLHSAIHTVVRHSKAATLEGTVKGGYEGAIGKGKLSGSIDVSTTKKKTDIRFKLSASGKIKNPDLNLPYKATISGKIKGDDERSELKAKYKWSFNDGIVDGKKVEGTGKGTITLDAHGKSVIGEQEGKMMLSIEGKKLHAKYLILVNSLAVRTYVRGKLDGEKFFLEYAASLNLASVGVETDPTEISRIYGKITVTKDGKKYSRKFDLKNNDSLLPSI